MKWQLRRGFTLVELLVVISIMAILASVLLANMASSAKIGRDTERQANLRNLQNAIEAYKHKNGTYPVAGCSAGNAVWVSEKDCPVYIVGLAPEFITVLPHDSARGTNEGYSYVTNTAGTVYKVMAMNTVEKDILDYTSPFKSCDIRYGDGTVFPSGANNTQINLYGWCSTVWDFGGNQWEPAPAKCVRAVDGGGTRFDKSYGLWGGYADSGNGNTSAVRNTTAIICK
jgi:prepilin-type N-terminal cleavage/methylation domain-containing protein